MRWDRLYISGTGHALGQTRMTTAQATTQGLCGPDHAKYSDHTAVTIADPGYPPPEFAVTAARRALTKSGCTPTDIGAVFHSYVLHPGVDAHNPASYVQRRLDIPGGPHPIEARSDGCHGGLNAVASACYYLSIDTDAEVALVSAADSWPAPPTFNRWDTGWDAPFGDGGSAAIITHRPGRLRICSTATASDPALEPMFRGDAPWGFGTIGPNSPLDIIKRLREHFAAMPGTEVYRRIALLVRRATQRALADAELSLDNITHYIPPVAVRSMLNEKWLPWVGLDYARVAAAAHFWREVGHIGSADQIAVLDHLDDTQRLRTDDHVLMVSDGGGVSATAAVIQRTGHHAP